MMLRMGPAFLLLASLWACSSTPQPNPGAASPATDQPAADSGLPRFAGSVGQLIDGSEFLSFVHTHEREKVALDVELPREDFQGAESAAASTFDVWEDCDNLQDGQKPGPLQGGCTGFEFSIPRQGAGARPLVRDGAVWRLRGQFLIEPAGGPLQGLMSVRLTPLGPAK